MKAVMVMFDSLNRHMLQPYGCTWAHTPNFARLAKRAVQFDNCYVGSLPCMPARRELHTGRYNFLHRSWGPLEPFDDSMPETLKQNGIYTHLVTDHYHYFEDGGATYHERYTSYEAIRGQEGDAWKGIVNFGGVPENRNGAGRVADRWIEQDFVNRSCQPTAETQPQAKTFAAGLAFIERNHEADNWFLQIETFDPHEPYFTQPPYSLMDPDGYAGPVYDWPEYRPLDESDSEQDIRHLRAAYGRLLAMCDAKLGEVLDAMDRYGLWEDTMLIVNTDHGFFLSEHGWWGKCQGPMFNELVHTPLFIWDPRSRRAGVRVQSLVQTIDLPATLLEFFGLPLFDGMQGRPLGQALADGSPVRDAALFGDFGGQVNCTDGRYVYMRSPKGGNAPLHQYTLMPLKHGGRRGFFSLQELSAMELCGPLPFTKGVKVLRTTPEIGGRQWQNPTALYDLAADPGQNAPLADEAAEERMAALLVRCMRESDAPPEQFVRLGLDEMPLL